MIQETTYQTTNSPAPDNSRSSSPLPPPVYAPASSSRPAPGEGHPGNSTSHK